MATDRRQLAEAFYRVHPDLRESAPAPLQASCDLAVAQFPGHLNSVGFLAYYTCPGATAACAACCYTEGGQAGFSAAKGLRARNTHALLELCRKRATRRLSLQLGLLMDRAHAQYETRLRRAVGREYRRLRRGSLFRHNWSGDLVDATHAAAVRRTVAARPHMDAWLYTRSFHLLEHLEPVPDNLTVWISDDGYNQAEADRAHRRHTWTRRASLVERGAPATGDVTCPKLRTRPGESQPVLHYRHACAICRICVQPSSRVHRVLFPEKVHRNQNPIPEEVMSILEIEPVESVETRRSSTRYPVGPTQPPRVRDAPSTPAPPEGADAEARYFVRAYVPVDPAEHLRHLVHLEEAQADLRHCQQLQPDHVFRIVEVDDDGQVHLVPTDLERAADAALQLVFREIERQRPYVRYEEWLEAATQLARALGQEAP